MKTGPKKKKKTRLDLRGSERDLVLANLGQKGENKKKIRKKGQTNLMG